MHYPFICLAFSSYFLKLFTWASVNEPGKGYLLVWVLQEEDNKMDLLEKTPVRENTPCVWKARRGSRVGDSNTSLPPWRREGRKLTWV